MKLKNKTVLITGATSGIGKATAVKLAQEGCRLILCGRRELRLQDLQMQLKDQTEITTLSFDVRDQQAVENAISSLPDEWKQIGILINNAGNAHGLSSIDQGEMKDYDAMIDGNVKGLLYVSACIIPGMVVRKCGHIVNLSSVAGKQTYENGTVYCASKKAVEAISEGMRLDLTKHGIKITNVAPGAVDTEFSEVRFKGDVARAGKVYEGFEALRADDIADFIHYVLSAPDHVTIADATIYPKAQAAPSIIHKQ